MACQRAVRGNPVLYSKGLSQKHKPPAAPLQASPGGEAVAGERCAPVPFETTPFCYKGFFFSSFLKEGFTTIFQISIPMLTSVPINRTMSADW